MVAIASACLYILFALPAINAQNLLQETQENHRQAVESVITCNCKINVTFDPVPSIGEFSGRYSRKNKMVRCDSNSRTTKDSTVIKDSKSVSLNTYPFPVTGSETSGSISSSDVSMGCSAYAHGLIEFFGSQNWAESLDELLAKPHQIDSIAKVSVEQENYVRLQLTHSRARLVLYFSPKHNYLVKKLELYVAPDKKEYVISGIHEVLEFTEAKPGIFFPTRIETVAYGNDDKKTIKKVLISDLVVNEPISDDVFQIRFPPGILVTDTIQGKLFRTDAQGNPTLTAKNANGSPLVYVDKLPTPSPLNQTETTQTQTEPTPNHGYWLVIFVLLLVIAVLWRKLANKTTT
jgi:hypothetical protein